MDVLLQFCDSYEIQINESFFFICGSESDGEQLELGDFVVEPCGQYAYLGSLVTCDGSVSSLSRFTPTLTCFMLNKFAEFLKTYNDVPFIVKQKRYSFHVDIII